MNMNTSNIDHLHPWQIAHWEYLIKRIQNNTLPHALLLNGSSGIGKSTFASMLAKLVLCATPQNGAACQQCRSCELFKANNHPDLLQLQPEASSNIIKVDQVREMIQYISKTSQQNGYKVVVINPADALHHAASNALLKTLEEPTNRTLLILISAVPSLLPATIRSRCQSIVFKAPQVIEKILPQQQDWIVNMLALLEGNLNPFAMAAKSMDIDLAILLSWLSHWLMDMTRMAHHLLPHYNYPNALQQNLNKLATQISLLNLFQLYDEILQIKKQIQHKINLNQQLLLERIFCSLMKIIN